MGRKARDSEAIVFFCRDVTARELNDFPYDFRGDVVINGDLYLNENLEVLFNLYVMGDIWEGIEDIPSIMVNGDLNCYGYINSGNINVKGSLYCYNGIDSHYITVGDDLYCEDNIDSNSSSVTVGGDLICLGNLRATQIYIVGTMRAGGVEQCFDIKVGT